MNVVPQLFEVSFDLLCVVDQLRERRGRGWGGCWMRVELDCVDLRLSG